ncbi:MAG TPA: SpoIVB peptidase S55 domain-containing protein [Microlunatus sp.]|nr:SpoIVB peptidase S55 domain-containing protein [Microlunatus sp.]
MALVRESRRWRGTRSWQGVVGATAALVLGLGTLAAPAHADPEEPPPVGATPLDCPRPVEPADITPGMVGVGWTVVRGSTPQPFRVEVLGVLTDGIGAGRDMVIIEVSDYAGSHVVDAGGGIWAGMSGSPVYVGGKLLGAVSYGFSASPSPIGGLTPASDMMDLLTLSGASARRAVQASERGPATVKLSAAQRSAVEARSSAPVPGSTLEQLRTPLSVSGLNSKRLGKLRQEFSAADRPVIAYAGSRATGTVSMATPEPTSGGNFAAVMSYGDVTIGGVGTTTAVCGPQALAFGHPADFTGKVSYGANDADSLTIVTDQTFGSFKMANIGATVGTVDQDRLAGLRAKLGAGPATVPITSNIVNLDANRQRTGGTQVAEPDYLTLATAYGIWANYDSTFDKIGRGFATTHWTITGTRAGGKTFSVERSNRWSDLSDPTNDPVYEIAGALGDLQSVQNEPVKITKVAFDSDISSAYQQLRVVKLAVSVNGGKFTSASSLRVKAGATLTVRATVRAYQSTADENVLTTIKVPKKGAGRSGSLSVTGGSSAAGDPQQDAGCLLEDCDAAQNGLDGAIRGITSPPQNNQVITKLSLDSEAAPTITVSASKSKRAPVVGSRSIDITVRP